MGPGSGAAPGQALTVLGHPGSRDLLGAVTAIGPAKVDLLFNRIFFPLWPVE
jgi:hypothetical protein